MAPSSDTRALLQRLMDALDYAALAEIYCDHGGEAFWVDRRGAVVDLGLSWAGELANRLPLGGRSWYVGAGVAELPALLTEVCDLKRECSVTSLRAAECETLNASIEAVGLAERLRFCAGDAADATGAGFDHLSLVSVLDDPETYPWISAVTYGRASALDLDVSAFEAERDKIRALVRRLCDALAFPALVTTTFDEAPWILERAAELGVVVDGDETMVETAVVGDPVGFLALRRGEGS